MKKEEVSKVNCSPKLVIITLSKATPPPTSLPEKDNYKSEIPLPTWQPEGKGRGLLKTEIHEQQRVDQLMLVHYSCCN